MNKLVFYRRERGLSQFDLAEVASVSRAKIQLIELGIRSATQHERAALAEALGIDEEVLFSTKSQKSVNQND